MFKVLIWDYTGISAQWMEQVADKKNIDVVGMITPQEPVPEILLSKDAWDWLLIFEQGQRNFFEVTTRVLRLSLDKVIYALDMNSWVQNPKAAYNLVTEKSNIFLYLNFNLSRQLNDYVTCTVEGLNYVATSTDNGIMRIMYTERKNFAANELNRFHTLSKKYYGIDDSDGFFLDLGANIGTSCIYFVKKFAPNLKILAFEPAIETFKMLRMNLIFNDLEMQATAVNCGLGEKPDELKMHYRFSNDPGANSLVQYTDDTPFETIKIIPIDSYLAENKIAPQEVKYMWIDTEGFEPQVLLGAKNLIRENPVPIFVEFNLGTWRKSGRFDDMLALLSEGYSHFVLNDIETLYPLDTLSKIEPPPTQTGTMGDIFLIKKGAI